MRYEFIPVYTELGKRIGWADQLTDVLDQPMFYYILIPEWDLYVNIEQTGYVRRSGMKTIPVSCP